MVGTEKVARAPADGSTLLFSIKEFQPVALLAKAPLLFVVNAEKVQAKNFTELVATVFL